MTDIDRRTFLIGAAGLVGTGTLLAACGDDSGSEDTTTPGPDDPGAAPESIPLLVAAFPDGFRAPSPFVHSVDQRVAYVLHDGIDIMRADAPEAIELEVWLDDELVGGGTTARRDVGVPTPYYAVRFVPPTAGTYRSVLTIDDETTEHEFLVLEPGETSVPQPGDILPTIDTPTFDDARGVDPICTRVEPCPFHETDLAAAVTAADRPIVLSIATPGFCQTAICGPVVDLLVDQAADRDDLHVVHAEVYVDPHNDDGIGTGSAETTPIVAAFDLPYEPMLLVAAADGTIIARLDAIYDGSELEETLALL